MTDDAIYLKVHYRLELEQIQNNHLQTVVVLKEMVVALSRQVKELCEIKQLTWQLERRRLKDAEGRGDELQRQLQAANDKETTIAERVDMLMQEKQHVQQPRDDRAQEARHRELQVHELRAQLEAMRQNFETQMKEQEGAAREDARRRHEQLQKAEEKAASLRGEIHARLEEAVKVDAELRDVREAEAAAKQRLVKLTEDHAMPRVHLESAKEVAVESTTRATQTEVENDSVRRELDEHDEVLREKEQAVRTLEAEVVEKQNSTEEIAMKKQTVQETTSDGNISNGSSSGRLRSWQYVTGRRIRSDSDNSPAPSANPTARLERRSAVEGALEDPAAMR